MGFWSWAKSWFGGGKRDGIPSTNKPLISLVWLLAYERFLDQQVIANLVQKAWDIYIPVDDPDAKDFVIGFSPTFMVQCRARFFLVHNFPTPYANDVEAAAKEIDDLRLRKAFLEHRAWIAVDLLFGQEGEDATATYPLIGKLMAELADSDCLALYSPATNQMIPMDESLEDKLRGPDVLEVFNKLVNVPVLEIADDDPRMRAAIAEAQSRWPEFVAAFELRRPEQHFAVKAPFRDGDKVEFMWATATAIEGQRVLGILDNDPIELRNVRVGSKVSCNVDDLNDWIIVEGQSMLGGFTIRVFEKRQS